MLIVEIRVGKRAGIPHEALPSMVDYEEVIQLNLLCCLESEADYDHPVCSWFH